MTDPIADMLTRIRNAIAAKKTELVLPLSKIKLNIADILVQEGYLESFSKIDENYGQLKVVLKYKNGTPAIKSIKRISKPGRRVYVKKDKIPKVLNNFGIAILSTPRGIMTNTKAKKENLGGEIICEVY